MEMCLITEFTVFIFNCVNIACSLGKSISTINCYANYPAGLKVV